MGFRQPGDRGHGNRDTKSACADSGVDAGRLCVFVAVISVARKNSPTASPGPHAEDPGSGPGVRPPASPSPLSPILTSLAHTRHPLEVEWPVLFDSFSGPSYHSRR